MQYTKPEVAVLGDAVALIEHIGKNSGSPDLAPPQQGVPAYDLDE
jgi:hypothetical protein